MSSLIVYKGQSWRRRLTVLAANTGLPIDLTGATIEMKIKPHTGSSTLTLLRTVGAGITLLTQSGATFGQADVDIQPDEVLGVPEAAYVFDVVVVQGGDTFRHETIPPTKILIRESVNSP